MKLIKLQEYPDIINSGKPLIIMAGADWCTPCRFLHPTVEKLAEQYVGTVDFYELDTDTESELAGQLGISAIPTLVFIKGSAVVDKLAGVHSIKDITNKIEDMIR
jgi:thioredoxin 1